MIVVANETELLELLLEGAALTMVSMQEVLPHLLVQGLVPFWSEPENIGKYGQ